MTALRAATLALTCLGILAAPSLASAQARTGSTTSAEYVALLGRAATSVGAGDVRGGIESYRQAVQLNPSAPDAICMLAEAQRVAGDLAAALDGYGACVRAARAASHQRWTAIGLHGYASTLERMPERLGEARTAWQDYVRFADGATQVAHAQVGRERITAIDRQQEQERVYVEVRQRIAERERRPPGT